MATAGRSKGYQFMRRAQFLVEKNTTPVHDHVAGSGLQAERMMGGIHGLLSSQEDYSSCTSSSRLGFTTARGAISRFNGTYDVVIGSFCTVGPAVKLGRACLLHPNSHVFGETEVGEGCILQTGAVVGADIPGRTILGKQNVIGHHALVGIKCQDLKYKEGDGCHLLIGNNNDIREFVSIHRSSHSSDSTIVGNRNLIMGTCHVAHDCKLGDGNILANGTLLGGHVILQDHVHTGGGVAVHQRCQIDSYAFVAGGSMVVRDVPMYVMVSGDRAELCGLNVEGLRRHNFHQDEVRKIKKAYQKIFMNTDGKLEERLAILESSEDFMSIQAVVQMLKSVRGCLNKNRRGICNFGRWKNLDSTGE